MSNAAPAGLHRPWIFLEGNLSEGFRTVGPFASGDAAAEWAEGREGWLMRCEEPEDQR